MKRESLRKVLSVTLAAAMTMGMAACGGGSGDKTPASEAPASEAPASEAPASEAPAPETPAERQTITFSVIDLNAGTNNVGDYAEQIIQTIEDYTNVDLDLVWYANDALAEKNSLALTSPSNMPQIMSWGGTVTGDVVSAAKNGAFVDLNDYVWDSAKYPNLSQMSTDVAANLTVDGKLIAIPRTRVVGRYGLSYRQDWAEALGVELPANATPDDVYKMLVAMKNGNDKHEGFCEYPMEMTMYTGPFDIIQTWFGCGNGWQEVGGQLVPVWETDNYFEAAEYIKKLYEEKLMPQDFIDRPTDTWSEGCKKGENGVYIDVLDSGKRIWQYFEAEDTLTPSVIDESVPASMVLYGAVNGHTLATAGYNGFFTLSATTLDTPEKIDAALTLLDKLNDPEMLTITQYGIEGVNYDMVDGYLVKTDKEDESLSNNYKGLNQLLAFLPSSEETGKAVPVEKDKFNQAQDEAYATALQYAEINPALSFLVNSPSYAALGADLDTQISAARTQYICGVIDLDTFKATLQSYKDQGYNDIIAEVNEQYAANK